MTKTYKGYQGSVTFDDGALIVTILHIRDFVSDECTSSEQVQSVFERLVDEYLEDCKAVGKEPERPYRGTFNVRVDPELHKRAVYAAASQNCSLNDLVGRAITQYLEPAEREQPLSSSIHQFVRASSEVRALVRDYIEVRAAEGEVYREQWSSKSRVRLHGPYLSHGRGQVREHRDWGVVFGSGEEQEDKDWVAMFAKKLLAAKRD